MDNDDNEDKDIHYADSIDWSTWKAVKQIKCLLKKRIMTTVTLQVVRNTP